MSDIRQIKEFTSGTAFISLPKKTLEKSDLDIGDNVQVLYSVKKKCIILVGVESDDINSLLY